MVIIIIFLVRFTIGGFSWRGRWTWVTNTGAQVGPTRVYRKAKHKWWHKYLQQILPLLHVTLVASSSQFGGRMYAHNTTNAFGEHTIIVPSPSDPGSVRGFPHTRLTLTTQLTNLTIGILGRRGGRLFCLIFRFVWVVCLLQLNASSSTETRFRWVRPSVWVCCFAFLFVL